VKQKEKTSTIKSRKSQRCDSYVHPFFVILKWGGPASDYLTVTQASISRKFDQGCYAFLILE
jgi:hypothetical protein